MAQQQLPASGAGDSRASPPPVRDQLPSGGDGWPHRSSRDRLRPGRWLHHEFMYARIESASIEGEEATERKLHLLPALASDVIEDESFGWTPTVITLLKGTHDGQSPLSAIRGVEDTVLRRIYSFVVSEWANHVTLTMPAQCVGFTNDKSDKRMFGLYDTPKRIIRYPNGRPWNWRERQDRIHNDYYHEFVRDLHVPELPVPRPGYVAFARCGMVNFPDPADRNINMMPFIIGDKSSLPDDLQCYYDSAIEQCPYDDEEIGKVGYLTVHESFVDAGIAQRREGLHIESPGRISKKVHPKFCPAYETIFWGCGMFWLPDRFKGGIFMASSVRDTSEVWDALVHDVDGIVDCHGSCEHLRHLIGPGTKLGEGELIWTTDRTPHQALRQETSGYRQFFRFVTSRVSHWYAEHSTPNPRVPLPDDVIVVLGNKFD